MGFLSDGWWVRDTEDDLPPRLRDAKPPWEQENKPKQNANRVRWKPVVQDEANGEINNPSFESYGSRSYQTDADHYSAGQAAIHDDGLRDLVPDGEDQRSYEND